MFYRQNRAFEGLNTQIHYFRTCRVATAVKVARGDYVALKIMKLSHGAIKTLLRIFDLHKNQLLGFFIFWFPYSCKGCVWFTPWLIVAEICQL